MKKREFELMSKKKCVKTVIYTFIPDEKDDWNALRQYALKNESVVHIYDEFNKNYVEKHCDTMGAVINEIENEVMRRGTQRVPTKKKKNKK